MKSFNLDNSGDITIRNNKIVMANGEELVRQKIQKVISTNKGEWFGDLDEGINFKNILKKGVTEEEVKSEILDGLTQINSSFVITDFKMSTDTATRHLRVTFKAETEDGEILEQEVII